MYSERCKYISSRGVRNKVINNVVRVYVYENIIDKIRIKDKAFDQ